MTKQEHLKWVKSRHLHQQKFTGETFPISKIKQCSSCGAWAPKAHFEHRGDEFPACRKCRLDGRFSRFFYSRRPLKECGGRPATRPDRIINPQGYAMVRVPGTGDHRRGHFILEHRYAMEQHLGRKLEEHERVHHLNGIRDDNRLENLELWSVSHPPGQRVVDKISWCREFLAIYGLQVVEKEAL